MTENERSKLDPLPEEKPTTSSPDTYKRVYPDWKPSTALEKTDVVGTIEAIEDAQATRSKDKTAWRKSNLNTSKIPEETESNSRSNRTSNTSNASSPLQSIIEEDRRKSIIQKLGERPSSDRLHIYIRRPSDAPSETTRTDDQTNNDSPVGITSNKHSFYIHSPTSVAEPRSPKSLAQSGNIDLRESTTAHTSNRADCLGGLSDLTNNKIEIDSDNIETPPTTRRSIITENKTIANPCRKLQTPRPLHRHTLNEISSEDVSLSDPKMADKPVEAEILGDGQFDRYSLARRTRRYRRPTDYSSGNEDRTETSPELSSPTECMIPKSKSQNNNMCLDKLQTSEKFDKSDDFLNRWQSRRSPERIDDSLMHMSKSADVLSRVGKVGRNLSSINQEDVREAIRNLKSPTEAPDRIWSPPREIVAKEKVATIKTSNHELNDEGFEETQSLVSDTPSHGKDSTSSYTDQPDSKTPKRTKSLRSNPSRSDSLMSSLKSDSPQKKRPTPIKSTVQNLLDRNRDSLERSRSLRSAAASPSNRVAVPRRTASLRKTIENTTPSNKRDVERSGSRTSLRSSRSSLNSATSINTVRNVPLKTQRVAPITTITLDKTLYKKPLILQNTVPVSKTPSKIRSSSAIATSSRAPASRSSSSGSSIGPSIRRSQTKSATPTSGMGSGLSTSFKENHLSTSVSRPAFRNAVSNSSHSNSSLTSNSNVSASPLRNNGSSARLSQLTKGIVSKTSRVSNFMRPTAASATKKFTGAKGK